MNGNLKRQLKHQDIHHEKWLKKIILILGLVALFLLIWTTTFNREFIVSGSEKSIVKLNHFGFIFATTIGIIFLTISGKLFKRFEPRKVFLIAAIIFFIAGLYMACNMPTDLNYVDQYFTYQIANDMNHGNFASLLQKNYAIEASTGGYLAVYPFQLGYVTFMRILECFSSDMHFFFIINIFFVILINYLLYRIVKFMMPNHKIAQNFTTLLSFSFLPQLFFIWFVYGNIPGLCACLGAVYFGLRWMKDTHKYRFSSVGCVLLFVLSYQLKSNYQIAVIALGIVFLLHAIKYRKYSLILMPIITFAMMFGSNKIITMAYEHESGYQIQKGLPMVTYIAMGLNKENQSVRCPGWYDGYTVNLYVNNKFDVDKTSKDAKKKIAEEFSDFIAYPNETSNFFVAKFISTWADPTFQSVWVGPWSDKPQTKILKDIYYENYTQANWYKKTMKPIAVWCNFLVIAILVLSAGLVIIKKQHLNPYATFALLYLMGGMIFHLFWETKSQYVFQYIVCLIPLAAMMIDRTEKYVPSLKQITEKLKH